MAAKDDLLNDYDMIESEKLVIWQVAGFVAGSRIY